ncbi:hypothetical protein [Bradyrhizobium manausense]|uniref:Uncharacterized protein n=1 Tax=Bradyrhizobium manausense TaxID=989370 RepID=A0A0R3D0G6_9BRAD|nr:hypothetical protein [Bradyrhizobium manausense]KRQ03270.1 hypothetical protein AOQ71_31575 [Bradyrhizobium manausense]
MTSLPAIVKNCTLAPLETVAHRLVRLAHDGRVGDLKPAGVAEMPITSATLRAAGIPDDWAEAVADACKLLFAASLRIEKHTTAARRRKKDFDALAALDRMRAAMAEEVARELMAGDTGRLLVLASLACPIGWAGLAAMAPRLQAARVIATAAASYARPQPYGATLTSDGPATVPGLLVLTD